MHPTLLATLGLILGQAVADDGPQSHPPLPEGPFLPVVSLQRIAWWAVPSNNDHYVGYYVGGGCGRPHRADPRAVDEGTWGWDYRGWIIPRRVILGWWHGRRYQGGTGAYRTDGPHYHTSAEGNEREH